MIGYASAEYFRMPANQPANEATVQAQCDQPSGPVRRLPRPDISVSWQQGSADKIAVSEDGGLLRQRSCDTPKLETVERLPVRKVDVRDDGFVQSKDLADAIHEQASLQLQRLGLRVQGQLAPGRQAVMSPWQWGAGVVAARDSRQDVNVGRRLLHEDKVGVVFIDQSNDVLYGSPAGVQKIPADDHPLFG